MADFHEDVFDQRQYRHIHGDAAVSYTHLQVNANAARLAELEEQEKELQEKVTRIMMTIPNIIDPSVPIGKAVSYTHL